MSDRTQGRRSSTDRARRRRWPAVAAAALTSALLLAGATSCTNSPSANPAGPGTKAPSAGAPSRHPSSAASSASKGSASKGSTSKGSGKSTQPSTSRTSAKTKPVPPAVRPHGNTKQKATTHKISYERRVPVHKGAQFPSKVAVEITKLTPVVAKPIGPGEVGGSAVAVGVRISNHSSKPLDLATTTVTMLGSDGSPGLLTTGGDADPLVGMLSVGHSADGTYVFTIANELRKPVTVQVQYGAGRTILQFSGNAA